MILRTAKVLQRIGDELTRGVRQARGSFEQRADRARVSFREASRRRLHREPSLSLVEWSELHRRHGRGTAAPNSPFRVSAMEVTRGVYLWCDEPGVREIGLMACTQSGKTTVLESIAGRRSRLVGLKSSPGRRCARSRPASASLTS